LERAGDISATYDVQQSAIKKLLLDSLKESSGHQRALFEFISS
jgi:hypothetical protein